MTRLSTLASIAFITLTLGGCDLFQAPQDPAGKTQDGAGTPPSAAAKPTAVTSICFGVYTSENVRDIFQKFTPIRKYLQDNLKSQGLRVIIKNNIYHSYDEAIDASVDGSCDFFRFGPSSFVTARARNPGIKLLAIEQEDGEKRFSGYIVARKDSKINAIADLKGATFAFGDQNSTIGRYLSQAELVRAGIHASDLADFDYLGRHDWVARSVADGEHEAGAINQGTLKKFSEKLKVVVEFPNVTRPWIARSELSDEYAKGLTQALLELTDKDILKALKVDGFLTTSDADFDFVREGMKLSEQF